MGWIDSIPVWETDFTVMKETFNESFWRWKHIELPGECFLSLKRQEESYNILKYVHGTLNCFSIRLSKP